MALEDTLKSNKQHAVPQNIMDVEFKLVGDLTMRQFAYLLILGLLAYFNSQLMVGLFKWPLTFFFAILGLMLAFVPIQDRGLDQWIINFFKGIYSPSQRVWRKDPEPPLVFMYQSLDVVKQELITLAPTSSRRKLEEYLNYQDQYLPKDPLDIPEMDYILKVRGAYATTAVTPVQAEASEPVVPETTIAPTMFEEEVVPVSMPSKTSPVVSTPTHTPSLTPIPTAIPAMPTPKPVLPPKPAARLMEQITQKVSEKVTAAKTTLTMPKRARPLVAQPVLTSLTPDRHSGRRFSSFLPTQGELILPIRGERVLRASSEVDIEVDIEEKARQLQMLLKQIKSSEFMPVAPKKEAAPAVTNEKKEEIKELKKAEAPKEPKKEEVQKPNAPKAVPAPAPTPAPVPAPVVAKLTAEAQATLDTLNSEKNDVLSEITKLKMMADTFDKRQRLERLDQKLREIMGKFTKLKSETLELAKNLESEKAPVAGPRMIKSLSSVAADSPAHSLDKPNIVTGFVKSADNSPIEGLVLIIKNQRGEPVRAAKTNSLGQFIFNTALTNGNYTLEVSPANKTGLTFDIISVEADGKVIPSVSLVGK